MISHIGSPFSSKFVVCRHSIVTLPLTIHKRSKQLSILNQNHSGGDSVALCVVPSYLTSWDLSPCQHVSQLCQFVMKNYKSLTVCILRTSAEDDNFPRDGRRNVYLMI